MAGLGLVGGSDYLPAADGSVRRLDQSVRARLSPLRAGPLPILRGRDEGLDHLGFLEIAAEFVQREVVALRNQDAGASFRIAARIAEYCISTKAGFDSACYSNPFSAACLSTTARRFRADGSGDNSSLKVCFSVAASTAYYERLHLTLRTAVSYSSTSNPNSNSD